MTINLINPNFNLMNTAQTSAAAKSGSQLNGATGSAGSMQSFTDVLETVMNQTGGTVNLDAIFQKASDAYNVPVELLKAVAKAESNFNPTAESHAGAKGIMQLMPGTAKALGVTDPFDPEQSIMGGAKYLSQQMERYDGNAVLALAAYNAGPGNVAKYNGVPPFKETQNYIAKVMGYAGETISAGEIVLKGRLPAGNTSLTPAGDLSQLLGGDMNIKDYAMLMDLHRYKMQLNVLTDSETDSESKDLFDSFTNLV